MMHLSVTQLAPVGVSVLISILSYGSQYFFLHLEPYSLDTEQIIIFNLLVCCIWISYGRACLTNPGHVLKDWVPEEFNGRLTEDGSVSGVKRSRWCKKCQAFKPPRAHHCKTCKRCIPKMDHHCPWTINCVSYRTFPHFMRFLFYSVASMTYLGYFLYLRIGIIWKGRDLPSYLGPSAAQMVFLFLFILLNFVTFFALFVMLLRSLWSLVTNVTTIESWEIERHLTLLRRARAFGGYLDGPDGMRVHITKQEFPYDIGIWSNVTQGMCGSMLLWLWPLAASAPIDGGLSFEVNGFEDPSVTWPPPDPDRIPRKARSFEPAESFTQVENSASDHERLLAFRKRQEQDLKRFQEPEPSAYRRRPFHTRYDEQGHQDHTDTQEGEEAWRNSEGDRLDDFGVDEEVEFYDEDDIPLAELIRRRQAVQSDTEDGRRSSAT